MKEEQILRCKCGAEADEGYSTCSRCREINRQKERIFYRVHIVGEHRCAMCHKPFEGKGTRCPTCAEKNTQKLRAYHAKVIEQRICMTCKKHNDRAGKLLCSACAKVVNDKAKQRRKEEAYKRWR